MHIIESKVQGDFTLNEAKEMINEIALFAKEQDCTLLLTDYREATVKLSMLEIYYMPKTILDTSTTFGLDPRRFKRALVISKDFKDFLFFENVMVNKSQNAKVFYDIDEAKQWLFKK
jgi:hypothetical protein